MFEKIISGESAPVLPEILKVTFKSGQKYFKHQTNGTNTVLFIAEGTGSFASGKYKADLSAGDVLYLPNDSECEYTFDTNETPQAYAISFKLTGKERGSSGDKILHISSENRHTSKIVRTIVLQMAEKSDNNTDGKELLLTSYLYKIIYELYSAKNERFIERGEIHRGIKYIESNYLDEFEIEEVARKCGMCLSLFYKNFKEATGLTPIEYKNSLKINRAIELLEENGHSVEDISKMLNFCNQSYFIRTFKHFTGCTPKQFVSRR